MQNDLVSIVIPTYNRFDKLERAVTSAVNQTYDKIEIIITSDNDDDTNKLLKEKYEKLDSRIKFVVNKDEKCVGNWNNGLSYANGEFIKILYDDDWLNSNCIEICTNKIGNHEGIHFVVANHWENYVYYGPNMIKFGSLNIWESYDLLSFRTEQGEWFCHVSPCGYLFRNKKLKFGWDFCDDERVKKWGSGSDSIYIADNLFHKNANKQNCLMVINDCLGNFDSHSDSCTVKNMSEVLKLTKIGMDHYIKKYNYIPGIKIVKML